eukprot:TRINITY_DN1877_c0_g1_i1.p1 TRINITY_DN1877_c0_g1~~TRINITY_DN1877_c0_g1_i1.p1  ORF type:complete len:600 (-),score=148.49 TRINITY_DN1877_c0_g1_i1:173-1972(-)
MLSEMQITPLFATAPDPERKGEAVKLSCSISDDGHKLTIIAVNVVGGAFGKDFGEPELTVIKGPATNWASFFAEINRSFSGELKVQPEGEDLLCLTSCGHFKLPRNPDASLGRKLFQQLAKFYDMRTGKPEGDTTELKKRLDELKKKVQSCEAERQQLADSIAASEMEERHHKARLEKAHVELDALMAQYRAEGKDPEQVASDGPVEPDLTTSLARIPIVHCDHREYDPVILRLVKSKFHPREEEEAEQAEAEEPWNRVIRPHTKSEYEQQMRLLPEDERRIVMRCIEKIDEWDYNVWTMQDFTGRGALFYTAYALFVRYNFVKRFGIDEQVLLNFLSQVEAGYHPNPYHNSMHGADVLHIVHYILSPGGLQSVAKLTDQDVLASLIAGMIHDYDHPGLNNNFHIKVQSYLATLYNDRSILENHHCAEVFELTKLSKFNILSSFPDDQRRDIRETIIDMVLSTDMGLHAKIFGTWRRRISQDTDLYKRKDDQRLALALAIKMADISNCGRPEFLYLRWASKLAEEFFLQGDNERNRGDTVSPFMDRFAPSMAKSQIAFMNYIVIPMFESIAEYLPEMHFALDHCESNKNYWASNDDSMA